MTESLRKAVREFRNGILAGRPSDGMCFAVCAPLQAWLSVCGIETELIEAHFSEINHVWLRLPDGRIIDPTADQFGLDRVYIGPLPLIYSARKARLSGDVVQGSRRPANSGDSVSVQGLFANPKGCAVPLDQSGGLLEP